MGDSEERVNVDSFDDARNPGTVGLEVTQMFCTKAFEAVVAYLSMLQASGNMELYEDYSYDWLNPVSGEEIQGFVAGYFDSIKSVYVVCVTMHAYLGHYSFDVDTKRRWYEVADVESEKPLVNEIISVDG